MRLSREATQIIRDAFQHFSDNDEETTALQAEYRRIKQKAQDILNTPLAAFELTTKQIVPTIKSDIVLNDIIIQAVLLPWGSEKQIAYENAFYDYLKGKYDFEVEQHQGYLLKATIEEAITLCIDHLGIK